MGSDNGNFFHTHFHISSSKLTVDLVVLTMAYNVYYMVFFEPKTARNDHTLLQNLVASYISVHIVFGLIIQCKISK